MELKVMLKMKSNPIDDEDVRVSVEVRGHRRLVDKIYDMLKDLSERENLEII